MWFCRRKTSLKMPQKCLYTYCITDQANNINSNSYWGLCLGRQALFRVMGSRMRCSQKSWGRQIWPPITMTQRHTGVELDPVKVQGWRKDSSTARSLQPLRLSLFPSKISHNPPPALLRYNWHVTCGSRYCLYGMFGKEGSGAAGCV